MVSLWPWKVGSLLEILSDGNSPASFERTLSNLSNKITTTTTNLESLRQRSRRFNVFWILYSSFAYLLYSIILVLIVGWRNWGLVEISAVIGGPVLIYFIRFGLITYYNYRTSKTQARLDELQKQRDVTIEQLKSATKYNTTQELLKKYGGAPAPKSKSPEVSKQNSPGVRKGKTGIVPPPTANIPGRAEQEPFSQTLRQPSEESKSFLGQPQHSSPGSATAPRQTPPSPKYENAEFAPNAFPSTLQYVQPSDGPRWYDRLMDALLGEDESLPRNRIALICNQCRLVNGQAPPGVKGLEQLGRWRCGGCGVMNGEEVEVKMIIASMKEEESPRKGSLLDEVRPNLDDDADGLNTRKSSEDDQSDVTQYSEASHNEDRAHHVDAEKPESPSADLPPTKRRVGRPRGSKNQGD